MNATPMILKGREWGRGGYCKGRHVHAVCEKNGSLISVCGKRPSGSSFGWTEDVPIGPGVTCAKCLARLQPKKERGDREPKRDVKPIFDGDVVLIPLTQGQYAIVDRADYEAVPILKRSWFARYSKDSRTFYPVKSLGGRSILMHSVITETSGNTLVDHIDFNGLNNRRSNLRLCGPAENARHRLCTFLHPTKSLIMQTVD